MDCNDCRYKSICILDKRNVNPEKCDERAMYEKEEQEAYEEELAFQNRMEELRAENYDFDRGDVNY